MTLSIKASSDCTSKVATLKPGTTVYLDSPHGAFTVDRHEGPGFVLVGITPLMSILCTFADRGDARPRCLFLNNRDWESITFRQETEKPK